MRFELQYRGRSGTAAPPETSANATLGLMSKFRQPKSYREAGELATAFMRKQFESVTAQRKELTEEAQTVCTDTAEPIKESFISALNRAA
jgi:hypothetical protein